MIEIRKMQRNDIEQVANLEKLIFSVPWSYQSLYESFIRPEYIFLVALSQEQVVGYVGLYIVLSEGDITNVAVLPEYRNKGIAKSLLQRLFVEAANRQKTLATLQSAIGDATISLEQINLEVRQSNEAAICLYESLNFKSIGIRKNFYDKPRENAILMSYILA